MHISVGIEFIPVHVRTWRYRKKLELSKVKKEVRISLKNIGGEGKNS
ncbi:MAG: hypothetical protein AB1414_12045 [bacterium]